MAGTSSFHLQLLRQPATDMPSVPHRAAQPGWQNACMRIRRDACLPGRFTENNGIGSSSPGHFEARGYKRYAGRRVGRSSASEWRRQVIIFSEILLSPLSFHNALKPTKPVFLQSKNGFAKHELHCVYDFGPCISAT